MSNANHDIIASPFAYRVLFYFKTAYGQIKAGTFVMFLVENGNVRIYTLRSAFEITGFFCVLALCVLRTSEYPLNTAHQNWVFRLYVCFFLNLNMYMPAVST